MWKLELTKKSLEAQSLDFNNASFEQSQTSV